MVRWLSIPGFERVYEVSDDGCVRNATTGVLLNPYWRGGYRAVTLRRPGVRKCRAIHQLVLEAFSGPRPKGFQGAHLDGDRDNNAVANLRWVTPRENEAHKRGHNRDARGEKSTQSKLTNEQAEIVREIVAAGISQEKVARLIGLSHTNVSKLVRRIHYPEG